MTMPDMTKTTTSPDARPDGRTDADAGTDERTDAGSDARTDASTDARTDTRTDTRTPAASVGPAASGDGLGGLNQRMERAIGDFVDDPRRAVREADAVLDEAAKRLTRLLEERRTSLRGTWHDDNGTSTGTEELRVALTHYRDLTHRLLDIA
jgi:hypothetical protein